MRFSVIITAHNLEDYIEKAISSVENQSFADKEIIVVCDACTDRTAEIVESHNVQRVSTDLRAPGLARNAGLDIARGEYVLFLDGDDQYLHNYALEMIDKALIAGNYDVLNFGFIFGQYGYVSSRHPNGAMWVNVWSRAWRRSIIGAERFGAARYAEDEEFCKRMFSKSLRMGEWNTPLVFYTYPRAGSLSEEASNK